MALIRSFRDLNVYQCALRCAAEIFEWSLTLPPDERYGLASQIRKSSRAVGPIIAEAWGRRRYERAFGEKLTQALGETKETQAWLDHARECSYINSDEYEKCDEEWNHVSAMIRRMIHRSDTFCTSD